MKFIVLCLVVIYVAGSYGIKPAPANACDYACTTQYDPVCGVSTSGTHTFGNACELGLYNCRNPSNAYPLSYPGECGGSGPSVNAAV
ncbi:hypothetical protein HA402_000377 [Bradysia odoriphaga]|nr:hypothetical protein HA402_000377 [Bradysia odoriphaga]